jgi:membrane protease YdiL (CAAX protease family)
MVVAGKQEPFMAGELLAFPQLTPSYHDWLWCIKNNPQGVDSRGAALLFAALPVTLLATLFGLSLFPPGIYLKIVLAAPGILVGVLFSYIYGFVVFRTPKIFGVAASVIFGSAGLYLLWQIVKHW